MSCCDKKYEKHHLSLIFENYDVTNGFAKFEQVLKPKSMVIPHFVHSFEAKTVVLPDFLHNFEAKPVTFPHFSLLV